MAHILRPQHAAQPGGHAMRVVNAMVNAVVNTNRIYTNGQYHGQYHGGHAMRGRCTYRLPCRESAAQ